MVNITHIIKLTNVQKTDQNSMDTPGRGSIFSSAPTSAAPSTVTDLANTDTPIVETTPSADVPTTSTNPIPYHGLLGHPISSPFPFTRVISCPTPLITPTKTSPQAALPPHLDSLHKDLLRELKSTYEPEFWQILCSREGGNDVTCVVCKKERATKLHHGFFSFLNPDAVGGLGRDGLLMYGVSIWDIVVPVCGSSFPKTEVNEKGVEEQVPTTCMKEAEAIGRTFIGRVWGGKPLEKVGVKCQGCGKVYDGNPLANDLVGEEDWGRPMRIELKRCTGCKSVGYCGRECQKRHWREHKLSCALLMGAAKARFEIDKASKEA
jgi:hypothetical protein